jgi:hypothetical protein
MEILFEITHSIMVICLTSIIYISMPPRDGNDHETKRPLITLLVLKARSIRINTNSIYRTAEGVLALLIR